MDIKVFIGACLLLATVASVSGSGGDAAKNFCQDTVQNFELKLTELFGDDKVINADYIELDESNNIPKDDLAKYRASVDLPDKQEACFKIAQMGEAVLGCEKLLKSSSSSKADELMSDLGLKAIFVCKNIYLVGVSFATDAQITATEETTLGFCQDTLSSLHSRLNELFGKEKLSQITSAIDAEYLNRDSGSAATKAERTQDAKSALNDSLAGGETMCREFEKMDEAAEFCTNYIRSAEPDMLPSSSSVDIIKLFCKHPSS